MSRVKHRRGEIGTRRDMFTVVHGQGKIDGIKQEQGVTKTVKHEPGGTQTLSNMDRWNTDIVKHGQVEHRHCQTWTGGTQTL